MEYFFLGGGGGGGGGGGVSIHFPSRTLIIAGAAWPRSQGAGLPPPRPRYLIPASIKSIEIEIETTDNTNERKKIARGRERTGRQSAFIHLPYFRLELAAATFLISEEKGQKQKQNNNKTKKPQKNETPGRNKFPSFLKPK